MVEDVDAVELGIVVAGVEAVTTDTVLVADDLPELVVRSMCEGGCAVWWSVWPDFHRIVRGTLVPIWLPHWPAWM